VWRVGLAGFLIALGVWLFVAKASPRMPDFEVYRRAGARAAAAEPLYRPADADYQFKYFPAFAVLAIPLGLLPHDTAKAAWFALSAAALAALVPLSVRLLPTRRKPVWLLVGALLVGLGRFYAEDLVLGQINTLVALTAAAALLGFKAGREAVGGALVAVAVVLKPYMLILVPWLAVRRNGRSIAACAGGLALACALPILFYGIDGTIALHREWVRTVSTTTAGTLLDTRNVSVASMWAKWLGIGSAATAVAAATSIALVGAAAAVLLRRSTVSHPDTLDAGLLMALTPLVSPQGWDYVLVLATMLTIVVVNDVDRLPRVWRVMAIAGIALTGLTLYDLVGRQFFYSLQALCVLTIGVLLLMSSAVMLRMRRLV
jgi:hypothetical protein